MQRFLFFETRLFQRTTLPSSKTRSNVHPRLTMTESTAKKFRSHRHCCVPFCTNDGRYDLEGKLSFHSFPSDKKLRKLWIRKIRRDEGINFTV